MSTAEIIKALCKDNHISLAQLARETGQSRQNLYQKLKRNTLSPDEMESISKAIGVRYEQSFVLPDGKRINLNSSETVLE